MPENRWEMIGAAGGILFVALQLAGQGLIQVGGAEPAFNAPSQEIVAFFDNRDRLLFELGGALSFLSTIPLLWFLGVLWARLRRFEGEPGWLSHVAFGSGLMGVAVTLVTESGWGLAMLRIDEGLSPEIARLLFDQGNFGFATLWVALASMLLASGVLTIQSGALPRWNGWLGVATAVALLFARVFWASGSMVIFTPYMLFWLWLIFSSISLIRQVRPMRQLQMAPALRSD